jgi:Ca-activated chloride channel family protein
MRKHIMAFKRISLALLLTSFLTTFAAAEGQRVILVLDASGSMRGKINGVSKMDIAKDVVGKVVAGWKPEDDLGLVVYGHREKGSCSDIETILPPQPLNEGAFMTPVKGLQPKGKTPMTQAVRQAAEALKYTEQKSTVILVSDGIETCDADPCAVARELEQAGVGLTVHTVGFGLDDKGAVAQLKCLAEETGGISVLASNADELEKALKQTVEAKVEEPPAQPEPVITKDLSGHVVMAPGVELPKPFNEVVWVFKTSVGGAEGEYISTEYGADLKADMTKSGELLASVTSDLAKLTVPFTHTEGKTTDVPVNLNAGIINFQGMMDESTNLPKDGPTWVFDTSDGTYYGTSYGGAPVNLFNAGDYVVKLQLGSAETSAKFTVVAGQTTDVVVTLGSGAARITSTYTANGDPVADGASIEIRKPADVSGQKEWVATEYGSDKTFQIPAGDYVVIVKLDLATAEMPLKVVAGENVNTAVNLNAGYIAASTPGATRMEVRSGKPALDGTREVLTTVYADKLNLAANGGTYHIVAFGADDAMLGEKDVIVEAGKRAEITVP